MAQASLDDGQQPPVAEGAPGPSALESKRKGSGLFARLTGGSRKEEGDVERRASETESKNQARVKSTRDFADRAKNMAEELRRNADKVNEATFAKLIKRAGDKRLPNALGGYGEESEQWEADSDGNFPWARADDEGDNNGGSLAAELLASLTQLEDLNFESKTSGHETETISMKESGPALETTKSLEETVEQKMDDDQEVKEEEEPHLPQEPEARIISPQPQEEKAALPEAAARSDEVTTLEAQEDLIPSENESNLEKPVVLISASWTPIRRSSTEHQARRKSSVAAERPVIIEPKPVPADDDLDDIVSAAQLQQVRERQNEVEILKAFDRDLVAQAGSSRRNSRPPLVSDQTAQTIALHETTVAEEKSEEQQPTEMNAAPRAIASSPNTADQPGIASRLLGLITGGSSSEPAKEKVNLDSSEKPAEPGFQARLTSWFSNVFTKPPADTDASAPTTNENPRQGDFPDDVEVYGEKLRTQYVHQSTLAAAANQPESSRRNSHLSSMESFSHSVSLDPLAPKGIAADNIRAFEEKKVGAPDHPHLSRKASIDGVSIKETTMRYLRSASRRRRGKKASVDENEEEKLEEMARERMDSMSLRHVSIKNTLAFFQSLTSRRGSIDTKATKPKT